jgi:hypothetical protein
VHDPRSQNLCGKGRWIPKKFTQIPELDVYGRDGPFSAYQRDLINRKEFLETVKNQL